MTGTETSGFRFLIGGVREAVLLGIPEHIVKRPARQVCGPFFLGIIAPDEFLVFHLGKKGALLGNGFELALIPA